MPHTPTTLKDSLVTEHDTLLQRLQQLRAAIAEGDARLAFLRGAIAACNDLGATPDAPHNDWITGWDRAWADITACKRFRKQASAATRRAA